MKRRRKCVVIIRPLQWSILENDPGSTKESRFGNSNKLIPGLHIQKEFSLKSIQFLYNFFSSEMITHAKKVSTVTRHVKILTAVPYNVILDFQLHFFLLQTDQQSERSQLYLRCFRYSRRHTADVVILKNTTYQTRQQNTWLRLYCPMSNGISQHHEHYADITIHTLYFHFDLQHNIWNVLKSWKR